MIDYRKAADIPDEAMVEAVRYIQQTLGRWAMRWEVAAVLAGNRHLLTNDHEADPALYEDQPGVPEKVVLAKIRRLLRRGLLDGCGCGCRGDLVVVGDPGNPYPSPGTQTAGPREDAP